MSETFYMGLMAVFQGIAEFLPISSSGHLALLNMIFGETEKESLGMIVTLHAGTLLSVLVVYYFRIYAMFTKTQCKWLLYVFIASIPTAIIGLLIKYWGLDDYIFDSMIVVGSGLVLTSFFLWFGLAEKEEESDAVEGKNMGVIRAFFIGIVQGIAIFPGVSRSGSTISAAVKMGVNRADAAAFSFIISLPAIGGAVMLEIYDKIKEMGGFEVVKNAKIEEVFTLPLIVGFVVSALVGIISLKLLIKLLQRGTLKYFAIYTFFVGLFVISFSLSISYQNLKIKASGGEPLMEEASQLELVEITSPDSRFKRGFHKIKIEKKDETIQLKSAEVK